MKINEIFENWLKSNQDATIKDAYMAGFQKGLRCKKTYQDDKKCVYFISFTYSKGSGCCRQEVNGKMDFESLDVIAENIEKKDGLKDVIINNFILLDE